MATGMDGDEMSQYSKGLRDSMLLPPTPGSHPDAASSEEQEQVHSPPPKKHRFEGLKRKVTEQARSSTAPLPQDEADEMEIAAAVSSCSDLKGKARGAILEVQTLLPKDQEWTIAENRIAIQ